MITAYVKSPDSGLIWNIHLDVKSICQAETICKDLGLLIVDIGELKETKKWDYDITGE